MKPDFFKFMRRQKYDINEKKAKMEMTKNNVRFNKILVFFNEHLSFLDDKTSATMCTIRCVRFTRNR